MTQKLTNDQLQDVVDYIINTYNYLRDNYPSNRAEIFKACTGLGSYQTGDLSIDTFVELSTEYITPYVNNESNLIWAVLSPDNNIIAKFYGDYAEVNCRAFFINTCNTYCSVLEILED